ncbi:MAG: hypothetical protein COZ18_12000 [Flexibacter sp. CG_4_10_14_3_um_filter_32_15]|nr:MAG: hypothetical protein COZ18_12000 [Flexibacter sp. CG_4_10_14_3_um_filter_32_15]
MKNKFMNEGGINGLGLSKIDTESKDFKDLQATILSKYNLQSDIEKLKNKILSIRFQMESYLDNETTLENEKIMVGDFIKKLLSTLSIKNSVFSDYINYDLKKFNDLIEGKEKINSDVAIKLGKIFDLNPTIWLQIENKNELMQEIKSKKEIYNKYNLESLLSIAS